MCISTATTASGIKITFDTKNMPITSGLKNLIAGKAMSRPIKNEPLEPSPPSPQKQSLTFTRGEPSAHCSAKEGFSYTLQSRDQEDSKGRSKLENSRKPRGKKQKGGITIRNMYIH